MSNTKKYFAGANTSVGFYNLFHNIRKEAPGFHYIIKGGAGTGKSTLMKTIANYFLSKNEEIELFYCSSDPSSLDGMNIKKHNITLVDGTSPHIVNDFSPSIEDKIINLGEYISPSIIKDKNKINKLLNIKKHHFSNCYSYLAIANELYKINQPTKLTKDNINSTVDQIINDLKLNKIGTKTKPRELFLNILNTQTLNFEKENNFTISKLNQKHTLSSQLLKELSNIFCSYGYSIIEFKNFLNPEKTESLYIEDLNLLIKQSEPPQIKNQKQVNSFINKAKIELNKASLTHKKIESHYIKKVNYSEINNITQSLINEIELRISSKL